VQVDDLIQVGLIGLSEALSRYEAAQGVQFETFATQRIRGAMIDELRESDWMSRGSRKSQKDIEQACAGSSTSWAAHHSNPKSPRKWA
jgi:RNA polymerase sigma factor for flagellar operon FliA